MFFDTREPAPLSVRWARVIAPLVMCFAYTVFRVYPAVHERIPLSELLSAGAMFAGLVLVAFLALGDLCVPRLGRYPAPTVEEEAPPPADDPRWKVLGESQGFVETKITHVDWDAIGEQFGSPTGRLKGGVFMGDLLATESGNWPGRADVKAELIKRAYGYAPPAPGTEELFTHEYVPQHHTPARGFLAPALAKVADDIEREARNMRPFVLDAFGQRTGGGRHALKDGE